MKPNYLGAMLATILFLVYPLSVGPVARVCVALRGQNTPPPPTLIAFYAPVEWVGDHFPAFNNFMVWYVSKWVPTDAS